MRPDSHIASSIRGRLRRWLARRISDRWADFLWWSEDTCPRCDRSYRWVQSHVVPVPPYGSINPLCIVCAEEIEWEEMELWVARALQRTCPRRNPIEHDMDLEILLRIARMHNAPKESYNRPAAPRQEEG